MTPREQVFRSLWVAHSRKWNSGAWTFRDGFNHTHALEFRAWRMAWWREMEKAFPEYIKDGFVLLERVEGHERCQGI